MTGMRLWRVCMNSESDDAVEKKLDIGAIGERSDEKRGKKCPPTTNIQPGRRAQKHCELRIPTGNIKELQRAVSPQRGCATHRGFLTVSAHASRDAFPSLARGRSEIAITNLLDRPPSRPPCLVLRSLFLLQANHVPPSEALTHIETLALSHVHACAC